MKKNAYLWVFIAVAVILCALLMLAAINISNNKGTENTNIQVNNSNSNSGYEKKNTQIAPAQEVDLTQENIDFEEDVSDLADDFIDDSSFDDEPELDSIENEIN